MAQAAQTFKDFVIAVREEASGYLMALEDHMPRKQFERIWQHPAIQDILRQAWAEGDSDVTGIAARAGATFAKTALAGENREDAGGVITKDQADTYNMDAVDLSHTLQDDIATKPSIFTETEHARLCREALVDYLCRRISRRTDVKQFRQHLPAGHFTTAEQVWEFLTSPVARHFRFGELEMWGVDPFTSPGEVVESEARIQDGYTSTASRPIREPGSFAGRSPEQFVYTIRMGTAGGGQVIRTATHHCDEFVVLVLQRGPGYSYVWGERYLWRHFIPRAPVPGSGRQPFIPGYSISGFSRTIVGQALEIAQDVSHKYRWDVEEVLVYLLANIPPGRGPVRAMTYYYPSAHDTPGSRQEHGPIEMSVQPWVQPKVIDSFYRHLAARLSGKATLPSPERLELFRFVNAAFDELARQEATEHGPRTIKPTWKHILNKWLETHPDYKASLPDGMKLTSFNRDYMDTKNALLPPLDREQGPKKLGRKSQRYQPIPVGK